MTPKVDTLPLGIGTNKKIQSRLRMSAGPWAKPNWLVLGITLIVALILPWGVNQVEGGRFYLHLIILFFCWGMVVQCWNLIMGVAGIYSFAQVAFFAVGGWASGLLAMHFGVSPWLSIWTAPFAAVIAALIIGLPTLRLRGIYVVLLTLAFSELLRNFTTTGPTIISGGGYGLRTVPKLGFEDWFGGGYDKILYYYVGLIFFVISMFAIWRILNSPIGMAFRALRDSETYAISRGVSPFRFKLFVFGFSAFFTGLAGGFLTHYQGAISPAVFNFGVTINLLAMIVLGGLGSFWGPILGTAILVILPEALRAAENYRNLALGISMALIAVLAPQGLGPLISDWVKKALRFFKKSSQQEAT